MEPIDIAFDSFQLVRAETTGLMQSLQTEADVRLKVIDRILVDVLRWPLGEISTEPPTGSGFADYVCKVGGLARLVVEAKRDGRSLGCENRQAQRGYRLDGGVFTSEAAKEGISQAIRYCGERNAELACVTNGREWIVFRGNRLGDGKETRKGMAFAFPTLLSIKENFSFFYNLLSYEAASRNEFRPYFNEAEGQPIRLTVFNKAVRAQGSAKFLRSSALSADLERIMSTFFTRLTGDDDPDLLDACFVETNESRRADRNLVRITEDLVRGISDLETTDADALTAVIRRATEAARHEFVIIIGTKGAGKSTFITRFFRSIIPKDVARSTVTLTVDLRESPGDSSTVVSWLDRTLLKQTETALFTDEPPDFNEIEGIFYDEYTRLKRGQWKILYESDHKAFQIKFGEWAEDLRRQSPHDYIQGLLRHIVRNRRKVPIVVFDNADHFDIGFQQMVYQYARSLYEKVLCLVILPITDRTSWQLSKHGALQSFDDESFFLPTPSTDIVIRKRIEFLERRIETLRQRPDERYFVLKGISLSITDLAAFSRTLQRVFLQTSRISRWIGDLANHDVRRALMLARSLTSSPHLRVEDLLKAYVTQSSMNVSLGRAVRALVRGNYDIYPMGLHDYVQDIFSLNADLETTPLLGLRILRLLEDVPVDEHEGGLIHVDQVIAYFLGANVEPRATNLWLDAMLKTGLCLSYDPTVRDVEAASRIEIAPAGKQHAFWATSNFEYLSAMADVTPVLDESTYHALAGYSEIRADWPRKTETFIEYLLQEDKRYCLLPSHPAYRSQERLTRTLETTAQRLAEMRSASEL